MRPIQPKIAFLLLSFFVAGGGVCADAPSPQAQKERAAATLEQDVKSDPQNAELWLHLGFAYRKLDQLDRAQGAFEKASSLAPQNQEALYMLGLIYEKEKRTGDALRVWKQYLAVVTDPEKRNVADTHIHHLSQ